MAGDGGVWLGLEIGRSLFVRAGGWVLVEEVEVSASEAFAGGWGVGVGLQPGGGGGAVEVVWAGFVCLSCGGGDGLSGGVEGVAPLVGEHDAGGGVAGEVCVAFDVEGAVVVSGVVVAAEGDEVPGVGGSWSRR